MGHHTTSLAVLSVAAVMAVLALALIGTSFGTDHWIEVTVNRNELSPFDANNPLHFGRNRGLFRTCYTGDNKMFLESSDNVVDSTCLTEQGYELERRAITSSWGNDYEKRIHLMRSHFAFFVIAMLMLVIGVIIGMFGCWGGKPDAVRLSGLFVFIAAFCTACGMALFHSYEYLEREKIEQEEFPAYWDKRTQYKNLQDNSDISLGYSYILGWVGMGIAAISAIMYLVSAFLLTDQEHRHQKQPLDDYTLSGRLPMTERNPGYPSASDMMMYSPTVQQVVQPYVVPASNYPAVAYDYNGAFVNAGYQYN